MNIIYKFNIIIIFINVNLLLSLDYIARNYLFGSNMYKSDKTLVLFLNSYVIERDYIFELLPSDKYDIIQSGDEYLTEYEKLYQLNKTYGMITPNILIYCNENRGNDNNYNVIRYALNRFHIIVLIHTSDEFKNNSDPAASGIGYAFYDKVPLVLRNYGIYPYRTYESPRTNVMQIPLGYGLGMIKYDERISSDQLANYSLTKQSKDRIYSWAFIGTFVRHTDRDELIQSFQQWRPHYTTHRHSKRMTPYEMRQIYNESKFVIIGRGQINLGCYRVFEAIICGAVPIVIGPKEEMEGEFEYDGYQPPMIYANSSDDAISQCKNMSDDVLDNMRYNLIHWYLDINNRIRKKIDHYIKIFKK